MSRTHKTKPFWVKLKQGHLKSVEIHHHHDGVCDMPSEEEACRKDWMAFGRQCHRSFVYTGIHTCCCSMCHRDGGWFPKKRERLAHKRECREWDKDYA